MSRTKKPTKSTRKKLIDSSTNLSPINSNGSIETKSSSTISSSKSKAKRGSKSDVAEVSSGIIVVNSSALSGEDNSVAEISPILPSIRTLSYTQVDKFHRCPYRYKKVYIDKEKELLPWYVVKGILAHAQIADILRIKAHIMPEWDSISNEFAGISNKVDEELTPRMVIEVAETVQTYMAEIYPMNHPKFVEYPLEVFEKIGENVIKWIGYIDVIEEDDTILDHKVTGRIHHERDPWQMNIYKRAYPAAKNFVFQEITPGGANFIQCSPRQVEACTESINAVVEQMFLEEYPRNVTTLCNYCFFKKTCKEEWV